VRDQKPLHTGNTGLMGGWDFEQLLSHLNGRVFFWPGSAKGRPIPYGERHFQRYADESPIILRLATTDLLSLNPHVPPEFCRYNSGSPRCTQGLPSPRGPETFVTCEHANFRPASVVEVTFPGVVRIPSSAQLGDSTGGPWRPL
jgi:hypothetical protein